MKTTLRAFAFTLPVILAVLLLTAFNWKGGNTSRGMQITLCGITDSTISTGHLLNCGAAQLTGEGAEKFTLIRFSLAIAPKSTADGRSLYAETGVSPQLNPQIFSKFLEIKAGDMIILYDAMVRSSEGYEMKFAGHNYIVVQ
ncbi:MAG: hypothetical protein M3Q97_07410 [Bacteroidota bacterium]|nr:hypothetical protein [Bacteroidota bacterium]